MKQKTPWAGSDCRSSTHPALIPLLIGTALILALFSVTSFAYGEKKIRSDGVLDLNRATATDLATLPGIGPATAKRIVELREKNGPFKRIEDLLVLRGMSVKKLEKIRSHVIVRPPTY